MTMEQNNANYAAPQMPQMPMGQQPQMAQPVMAQQPMMPQQPVSAQPAQQTEENAVEGNHVANNGFVMPQQETQNETGEQTAQPAQQFVAPGVAAQMQQQQVQQQAQQQFMMPQAYQAQQNQGYAQAQPQMQNGFGQQAQGFYQAPAQVANGKTKTPMKQVSNGDGYTTGQKVGWAALGLLMGIPAILVAWLCNVPTPEYRSDAIKFTVIGLIVNILATFFIWSSFMNSIATLMGGGAAM